MKKPDHIWTWLLLLLALIGAVNFIWTAADLAPYPHEIDYSEGFMVADILRLSDTGRLYLPPGPGNRFDTVKYPPLYFLVTAAAYTLTGAGFLPGRLVNIGLTLLVTLLIYLITRHRTQDTRLTLAASTPLLFLAPYLTFYTGATIRVDMLAVAFSLGGILLFIRKQYRSAAVLFVFAFFTKQVYVSGFLAGFTALIATGPFRSVPGMLGRGQFRQLYESYRELVVFTVIYVAGIVAGGTILLTWQPTAYLHIVQSNIAGFDIRWDLFKWLYLSMAPLLATTTYYIYRTRDMLFSSLFLISITITSITFLQGGTWVYAALEPFAIALICAGVLLTRTDGARRHISLLLILQVIIFFSAPLVNGSIFDIKRMDDLNRDADSNIMERVRTANGSVYTEHASYLLYAGGSSPPEIYGVQQLYEAGYVTEQELHRFFNQQNYTLLITYSRFDNLPVDTRIDREYHATGAGYMRVDSVLAPHHWKVYRRSQE